MIRLALLRHGHTAWNRAGRIQGRTDIPLDADARAHLATRRLPVPWDTAAVVASPLARARETAKIVSDRPAATDVALIEMDWGDWEGKEGKILLADPNSGYCHIEDWGWDFRPPGGESPRDLRARLIPWAMDLGIDTLAVCHIGIMRVLMAHATGWDFNGSPPFQIKRDRLYIIEIEAGGWRTSGDPIRLTECTP